MRVFLDCKYCPSGPPSEWNFAITTGEINLQIYYWILDFLLSFLVCCVANAANLRETVLCCTNGQEMGKKNKRKSMKLRRAGRACREKNTQPLHTPIPFSTVTQCCTSGWLAFFRSCYVVPCSSRQLFFLSRWLLTNEVGRRKKAAPVSCWLQLTRSITCR